MVLVQSVVHPRGLHPVMAVRAHHLYTEEGLSYAEVRGEVRNMQGKWPSLKSVWSGVKRAAEVFAGKAGRLLAPESCNEPPGPDSWKNNVGARVLQRAARSR